MIGYILIYNIGYASPMILLLLIFLSIRRDSGYDKDGLEEKTKRMNRHLTSGVWACLGFLTMVDAGCYFALGHGLIRGRMF